MLKKGSAPGIPEPWAHIIAAKDETIRMLQEEVARLLPLALLVPKRRRFDWFSRWKRA